MFTARRREPEPVVVCLHIVSPTPAIVFAAAPGGRDVDLLTFAAVGRARHNCVVNAQVRILVTLARSVVPPYVITEQRREGCVAPSEATDVWSSTGPVRFYNIVTEIGLIKCQGSVGDGVSSGTHTLVAFAIARPWTHDGGLDPSGVLLHA